MIANAKQRLIVALTLNKLGDILLSAKATLPALLVMLGAPLWMISWLVPVRESGALLPQALISMWLRQFAARHIAWRAGMLVQIFSVLLILIAALNTHGIVAGYIILGAVTVFSIGRSVCSLTIKDIQADVAPKGERGRLLGIASTLSGVVTLGGVLALTLYEPASESRTFYFLLAAIIASFALTVLVLLPQRTYVYDARLVTTERGASGWGSVVYRFIVVRGLLTHSALVAPYFMLVSGESVQALLPVYLAAEAMAALLSSFIWGRISDSSARATLRIAGLLAVAACCVLYFTGADSLVFSGLLYFVLSIAHTGVRTGRQTYSLDIVSGHSRTELVAFSNTATGFILLGFGALYATLHALLGYSIVLVMAFMLTVGTGLTWILPAEKENTVKA